MRAGQDKHRYQHGTDRRPDTDRVDIAVNPNRPGYRSRSDTFPNPQKMPTKIILAVTDKTVPCVALEIPVEEGVNGEIRQPQQYYPYQYFVAGDAFQQSVSLIKQYPYSR